MISVPPGRTTDAGAEPGAAIADWLAGLFFAPLPGDVIADYCSNSGGQFLEAMAEELGSKPGIDRMRSALAADVSQQSKERELSIAYTSLFEGIAGPGTVPLYESAYAQTGSRLFQKATGDMDLLLRRFGLSVTSDCCEPPDHLSIELALLSTVMRRKDAAGTALLHERLRGWASEFAARCTRADTNGFYAGAAMVLKDFLSMPLRRNAN